MNDKVTAPLVQLHIDTLTLAREYRFQAHRIEKSVLGSPITSSRHNYEIGRARRLRVLARHLETVATDLAIIGEKQ